MNNKNAISLSKSFLKKKIEIKLPASKSISNRALIINALCENSIAIMNLSEARDTQTMLSILDNSDGIWNVKDAGTTMRFLTAYACVKNLNQTITGTERMQQRPIEILVNALRALGAEIDYQNNEGYPPITISSFLQKTNIISIRGDVSSQYISALLMIAPCLENGLTLTLEGKVGSKPYIEMTLDIMRHYGITSNWSDNTITITPQPYKSKGFSVEPDWSAASYWYSLVALSNNGSIMLTGLTDKSVQGDRVIVDIMEDLGVTTEFTKEGALLTKKPHQQSISIDFSDCPDLAQTICVVCAVKGIVGNFTGLESLKIKETDRVAALQNELSKIGGKLVENEHNWVLEYSNELPQSIEVNTYEDHRMAMAFAPLCLHMDVSFDDKEVVRKSYPHFWTDLAHATATTN